MAHRKPPERSQAGATGKELKKKLHFPLQGSGNGRTYSNFWLKQGCVGKKL
ncbi:hypothetical protein N8248_01090 [Rhodospirillaceae bacterium]|nr:hypothetical protein [Rhodospirillaceae bacterium]